MQRVIIIIIVVILSKLHFVENVAQTCPAPPAIKAPSLPQDTQVYPINSTYTYTCNNSNLVGNAINICTLGGWAYPAPQCLQVCYAPPVATNGSYSLLSSYYVVGGSVTYTCNAGFLLVGSIRNTCLNNLTWSSAAPECQPVCGTAPSPKTNGIAPTYSKASVIVGGVTSYVKGTSATYTCNARYGVPTYATAVLLCLGGNWNGLSPICKPNCLQPPNPQPNSSGPRVDGGNGFPEGSVAVYGCNAGFAFNGSSTLTCGSRTPGVWGTGVAPSCVRACPSPPMAANGSYSLLSSYYVVGGSVTYTCNAGFLLVGLNRNICLKNLTWSSAAPECQPVCYSPPPINGEGNITPGKRYYNINDTVSYTCVHGNLFGNSSNQCVSANKWRNAAPTCWLMCLLPPVVANGLYASSNTKYTVNSTVTYSCMSGHTLVGVAGVTCQSNFTWGKPPVCFKGCGVPPPFSNGIYVARNYPTANKVSAVGKVLFHFCIPGFSLSGSKTSTCLESGQWGVTGESPICGIVNCSSSPCYNNGGCHDQITSPDQLSFNFNSIQSPFSTYYCKCGSEFVGFRCQTTLDKAIYFAVRYNMPYLPKYTNTSSLAFNQLATLFNINFMVGFSSAGLGVDVIVTKITPGSTVIHFYVVPSTPEETLILAKVLAGFELSRSLAWITNATGEAVCAPPPTIVIGNGTITPIKDYYIIHETVTYHCVVGRLVGNTTNQCSAASQWMNQPPKCLQDYCDVTIHNNLTFPRTSLNNFAKSVEKCPNGIPRATMRCNTIVPGSGYFNTNTFTIVSCDITVGAIESNTTLTTQSSVEQTANILEIVTSAFNLTSHEITSVATVIDDITTAIQRNNFSVNIPLLQNIALTISHISATLRTQTIATNSSFVQNLDFFARKVETNGASPVQIQTNQLQIEVAESSRNAPAPTWFASQFPSTWVVNISLPLEAIQRAWKMNIGSKLRTIFVCHRDSALFPTNNKPGMVMSADFGVRGRIMNLKNPVTIEFVGLNTTHGRRKEGGKNYFVNQRCVFWDFGTSDWSSEGCGLDVTKQPPTCECSHLTNFALLVSIHPLPPDVVLNVLSKIGSAISMFCFLATALIIVANKEARKQSIMIVHLHICINLLVVYSFFLFGVSATNNNNLCTTITIILHLAFLTSFMWMAVYSNKMYFSLIKIMAGVGEDYLLKASIVAYGVPVCIVGLNAGIALGHQQGSQTYKSPQICWLHGKSLIYGFLLPVGLVLVNNLIVFGLVIRQVVFKTTKIRSTAKKRTKQQNIMMSCAMSLFLGLTWLLCYFMLLSSNEVYQRILNWLFVVSTSVQVNFGVVCGVYFCTGLVGVLLCLHQKKRYVQVLVDSFDLYVPTGGRLYDIYGEW
uniref:uncharacterized protein LOC100184723 isoform X2 n=1 Tax=Ciona intestinalis TaxID=7719 RepID=UPI000EF4D848|nr:uncharacterized protein LOC100184723 isoform X2 [Ciona intestinalis]|eukprot:XP_026694577.1 uncharacterized protein LOC100184723 isoform X2 [Ciona intestinalis]